MSTKEPYFRVEDGPGEVLYCACGRSKNRPYCDGSHGHTGISPWRVEVPGPGPRKMKICGCGKTGIGPFCDDSHAPSRKPMFTPLEAETREGDA
jgi:CDGSH-type Zn-finger protein